MDRMFPILPKIHQSASVAGRCGRILTSAAAGLALLAVPVVAGASTVLPALASFGAGLCAGVSPASVSSAAGFTVSTPTPIVHTNLTFDAKLKISEKETVCDYAGHAPSATAPLGTSVSLAYETLSKAPTQAEGTADLQASFKAALAKMPAGSTIKYALTTVDQVSSIWFESIVKEGSESFGAQFQFGWKGTKVAGAYSFSPLSRTRLNALEGLALKNYGM